MSSITITYKLNPPSGITAEGVNTSSTLSVPVNAEKSNQKAYYATLHDAIKEATDKIGVDLTKWRDAVGKAELTKEPKGKTGDEADAEDEEEEEEEDA